MSCEKRHGLRATLVRYRELCLEAMNKLLANSPLFQTNWIVPRNVMCILFWIGVFVVFMGMILLVTSKHKGTAFLSWGGVVLGIGLCLLLVCLMLCIHAYCVVANASRAEDVVSYASPTFPRSGVGEKVLNSKDHKENSNTLPRHSKNRPSAVRFNLVEDSSLRHSCQIERNRHPTVQKLALNPTFDIKKSIQKSSQSTFQTDTMNLTPSFPNSIVVESEDDRQEHKKSLHDHSMNKLYNISTQKLLSENLQNMPMTRNFGVSKITVTPIYHNHYEYKTCDARPSRMDVPPSRLHAIQQGHIVTGNRPEFNPLFPDCSSKLENPAINESELRRFPLLEVGDSKATVYDNVQYYCM